MVMVSAAARAEREVLGLWLESSVELLVGALRGEESALVALAAARSLGVIAEDVVRSLVGEARAEGRSWGEIGAVLHVTRQGAFQRFGGRLAEGEGTQMEAVGGEVPGAGERAVELLRLYFADRWEELLATFGERLRERCSAELLESVAHRLGREAGSMRELGRPQLSVRAGFTVVDVPLAFERGERTGRVSFDADGRVAGFFLLPVEAA